MKPTETTLIFAIFFLWKWKNCFHYCQKSVHPSWFGSYFFLRALVLPFSVTPESSASPCPTDYSPQHTHILLYLPYPLSLWSYHSIFVCTVSMSSSLYSTQMGLLFLYITMLAVSKAIKPCFHAAKCHGYFLSSVYSTPKW